MTFAIKRRTPRQWCLATKSDYVIYIRTLKFLDIRSFPLATRAAWYSRGHKKRYAIKHFFSSQCNSFLCWFYLTEKQQYEFNIKQSFTEYIFSQY